MANPVSDSQSTFASTASLENLRRRSEVIATIRTFFESREFIHVDTPLVSADTVVDRYIEPVTLPRDSLGETDCQSQELFLQTSPEFAMKRLLASGAKAIYQICKAFRKGESGRHHQPEFTMLEWYRVGDDLNRGIELLADFAKYIFQCQEVRRISYQSAFKQYASIDPFECSLTELRDALQKNQVDTTSLDGESDRDMWLNLAMAEIVETGLGRQQPEVVYHWPASQAALARTGLDSQGHAIAERFELFYKGIELANGYHELLDADELLIRNQNVNQRRLADGVRALPEHSRLLEAMQAGLPPCSGVALGVDRLLMILLEADSISDVIPFPFERA